MHKLWTNNHNNSRMNRRLHAYQTIACEACPTHVDNVHTHTLSTYAYSYIPGHFIRCLRSNSVLFLYVFDVPKCLLYAKSTLKGSMCVCICICCLWRVACSEHHTSHYTPYLFVFDFERCIWVYGGLYILPERPINAMEFSLGADDAIERANRRWPTRGTRRSIIERLSSKWCWSSWKCCLN